MGVQGGEPLWALNFLPVPLFFYRLNIFVRVGQFRNKRDSSGVLQVTMGTTEQLISTGVDTPWDACIPTTLKTPKNTEPILEGLRRQKDLLEKIALTRQAMLGASASQLKLAVDHFQKTIGPLLEWAKKPRVRSELFMYRRSVTGDKFSKLVSQPLEALVEIMVRFANVVSPKRIVENPQRRAQIMSIRGLALSCAPNYPRISDINSSSRLYRGFA
jgi:hypothetical protein